MRGDGLTRRLWAAQTSRAALRRRLVGRRLGHGLGSADGDGVADDGRVGAAERQASEPGDGHATVVGQTAMGIGDSIGVTSTPGTDEYWDEVKRVLSAEDQAKKTPIAVPWTNVGRRAHGGLEM